MTEQQSTTTANSTADQPCLSAEGLSRAFGSVTVVADVDLSLSRGTLHAVIGPNGSGKTTLLELLAGLGQPTSGTVTAHVDATPRTIGYLPQRPAFRPSFTALETLEFYTALVGDDPEALLARVGLGDAADRRVEDLSGGMTRLLGLAQAIAGDPPIVLLDEPGSGLDPGMRARTIEVARSLADDGTSVLYTTHDLELAEQFCDSLSVLNAGSVAATGSPTELLEAYDATSLREVFDHLADTGEAVTVLGESDR
ncbi:ABC transporter ATP-binding protein [Halovenus halobia]|uniref:ABC transporter ATP-binding protein n=1 Tax=Halovenus halobia TaxID=3396622 RepID=UPI003F552104